MPATLDIDIYRGDDFAHTVTITDTAGSAINVSGRTYTSQLRRYPDSSTVAATFTVAMGSASSGVVVFSLADAIDPRYRAWVLVAGYGGLRWGELQGLRPEHVHGNELTVLEQLSGELKTDGSRRRVVLPPSVGAELAAHLAAYPGEYVFTRPTGEPLVHTSFNNNRFKKALAKAGLDTGLRMHDLRHTAIAIWIQSGAHPKLIADMAGHSSIMVTMDRYGHLFPAMHEEVAVKVDEIRKAGGKHLRAV